MKALLRVVAVFAVITLGAGLGAGMHQQVQTHDASLRSPGEIANRHIMGVMLACRETRNPDLCALINGITI